MTFEALAVVFLMGTLMGLGFLLHFAKMGIKRVLGYDLIFDIFMSVVLIIVFHGTQGGMMLAIIAGIVISVALRVARWLIGYEQIGWVTKTVHYQVAIFKGKAEVPCLGWKKYPPRFQRTY